MTGVQTCALPIYKLNAMVTLGLWFPLQAESSEFRQRLDEQSERLQRAEGQAEDRGQRVEELQRLLGGMEVESAGLKDKMAATEAELQQLRESKEEVLEKERR